MPDATRKTISATEASALFNCSRYVTRWMLYQRFANGIDIDQPADDRMDWGTRMEPLVLQAAAEDQRMQVVPNARVDGRQPYISRGLLGCTRDATIICPDRGPGALETKCVFDYRSWMTNWDGGKAPPHQNEIQIQVQMMVGDGMASFNWGLMGVWCCGDMFYFPREPIPELWDALQDEAVKFFDDVLAKKEPQPFGVVEELPLIRKLYPPIARKVIDLTSGDGAYEMAMAAQMLAHHSEKRLANGKEEEALKARLKVFMRDAEELRLPDDIVVRQKKHGSGVRIDVYVPEGMGSLDG